MRGMSLKGMVPMKKVALLAALAMIVASPAMAQQKKAKRTAEPPKPEWQKTNENSYNLVKDSLPMWLPHWAQPVYQYGVKGVDTPQDTQPKKKKAAKKPS